MTPQPRVLYLTRNGLLEPLGQSQIAPYLRGLSKAFALSLISFEKSSDRLESSAFSAQKEDCQRFCIRWIPLRFRATPRPLAPAFGLVQLAVVALQQCLTNHPPQLIHARSYVPAAIALLLHRLTRVPFIFDMRALWPEELITAGYLRRHSLLHRLLIALERRCLREASGVVSLSQSALAHLKATYPTELAAQRLVVIPTCADLERFTPASTDVAGARVYGCIGTVLSGWFQIRWLAAWIEAMAKLDPSACFEIISRDDPVAIREQLKPSASWQRKLRIASAAPAEMPAVLQRHTASVMFFTPGLSKLGSSPTRLAEVLACGRPVVANPGVGDVGAIVSRHRAGVLVDSSEPQAMEANVHQLHALLREPDLASRCRSTAERLFSLEAGTEAYRQLYADILA
jgi:glycosyltransferase involved in cell wall biosynthesis